MNLCGAERKNKLRKNERQNETSPYQVIHVDHLYGNFETNVKFGLAGRFYVEMCLRYSIAQ